jgi:predicted regulator of Ras-like GTPase activity (Roadblock/LC7/MglB family)
MSIRDSLKEVVENVDGALAAMIMAYDGIPIDEITVPQPEFDLQSLSVEYATVLKEIKRAAELVKAGAMEEVSITTNRTRVAFCVLNEDLFAVLIMTRDGNFGKGRYMLRLKAYDLIRELA